MMRRIADSFDPDRKALVYPYVLILICTSNEKPRDINQCKTDQDNGMVCLLLVENSNLISIFLFILKRRRKLLMFVRY